MKLKDNFITHKMGDEILLISADDSVSQGFIRGNSSTAIIIEALKNDVTESEIVDRLCEEYDAPRDTVEADVKVVIQKLSQVNALDGRSDWASKSSLEEQLKTNGKIIYHVIGDSMAPLLKQGRDVAVIVSVPEGKRLGKYDVPLYKRESGQYVLHRIIKVRKRDYVTCGDNRYVAEAGVTDKQIIGVLDGVIRDGELISVKDERYIAELEKHHKFRVAKGIAQRVKRKVGGK